MFGNSVGLFSDSKGVGATRNFWNAVFFLLRQAAGDEAGGHCFFVRTAFKVEDILSKALGPDKLTRFMGVIIGLFLDDGPTTVQVLQAFRSCDPPASRG